MVRWVQEVTLGWGGGHQGGSEEQGENETALLTDAGKAFDKL